MSNFGKNIGALIRSKRERSGYTRRGLAELAFDDPSKERRIAELESGEVSNPQAKTFGPIVSFLGITDNEVEACRSQIPQKPELHAQSKNRPDSIVVDAWAKHDGEYSDLQSAIDAATVGTEILVKPGIYEGQIVIQKAIKIKALGDPGEVVLHNTGDFTVRVISNAAHICGFTIVSTASADQKASTSFKMFDYENGLLELEEPAIGGVKIDAGIVKFEDCLFPEQAVVAVVGRGICDVTFDRCKAKPFVTGIMVYGGRLKLTDCEISGGAINGVSAYRGHCSIENSIIGEFSNFGFFAVSSASATLRSVTLRMNKEAGVYVRDEAKVKLEDCKISQSKFGLWVKGSPSVSLLDCELTNIGNCEIGGEPASRRLVEINRDPK